jgi:hypothetical protein
MERIDPPTAFVGLASKLRRYKNAELDVVLTVPHESGGARDQYYRRLQTLLKRYGIQSWGVLGSLGLGAGAARFDFQVPPTVPADVFEDLLQIHPEMEIKLSLTVRRARRVPQSPRRGVASRRKARLSLVTKNAT